MPSRHCVHWPQVSWRKKRAITVAARTGQVESSMTTMPPVPSSVPAFCSESWSMCTSILSAVSTGIDTPPGMIALIGRPVETPPACFSMISCSGVPSGSS